MFTSQHPIQTDNSGTAALRQAAVLGRRLVNYDHNDKPAAEAPHPAANTRIRVVRPGNCHVRVTDDCKEHNTAAQSLGAGPEWLASWGIKS